MPLRALIYRNSVKFSVLRPTPPPLNQCGVKFGDKFKPNRCKVVKSLKIAGPDQFKYGRMCAACVNVNVVRPTLASLRCRGRLAARRRSAKDARTWEQHQHLRQRTDGHCCWRASRAQITSIQRRRWSTAEWWRRLFAIRRVGVAFARRRRRTTALPRRPPTAVGDRFIGAGFRRHNCVIIASSVIIRSAQRRSTDVTSGPLVEQRIRRCFTRRVRLLLTVSTTAG